MYDTHSVILLMKYQFLFPLLNELTRSSETVLLYKAAVTSEYEWAFASVENFDTPKRELHMNQV